MSSRLAPMLAAARSRADRLAGRQGELRRRAAALPPPRDFAGALGGGGLAVIAELKRRSPSAGRLADDLDPPSLARTYEEGGAAAVSVLTEPDHFGGSLEDLRLVRDRVALPLLRKDFVVGPEQVWESRLAGADAVLLVVAALTDDELAGLIEEARSAGLEALVEVHDAGEAERALEAGARLVGVNNRDLHTFRVELGTAEALAPLLADAELRVAESGIFGPEEAARMARAGYQAVLVGEALVRSPDAAGLVRRLAAAGGGR